MNILAIESSGLVASAAILNDEKLVSEYTMNNKQTHSQTLLPMIDEIVRAAGMDAADMDYIAISRGPGSFTGLRIGSATAKGLGLALKKPIIEVPTLEALAWNLYGCRQVLICPIMDARRQEVYSGVYRFIPAADAAPDEFVLETVREETAGPLEELVGYLNGCGTEVIFTGDGVPVYRELIREKMSVPFSFASKTELLQRASSVAELGLRYAMQGKAVTAEEHSPVYLRVSQAERESLMKGKQ